jgi:tetratricopeptide (TPR) repeat protein
MLEDRQQAEEYYQKALEIKIDFNDRYRQASTYHQLGMVAQVQRKWPQAEEYYQKALEIYIDFNDRYEQGHIYYQLGTMAMEQRLWDIARENLLKALEIFIEFRDQQNCAIALGNLARLWQATTDCRVLDEVTRILSIGQEEAKKLLEGGG